MSDVRGNSAGKAAKTALTCKEKNARRQAKVLESRKALERLPGVLKENQDMKETIARLERQLLECRQEKEVITASHNNLTQAIQGVIPRRSQRFTQPVDNAEPLEEVFTPEQAVLVQRQLAERDQHHQQAMQELIFSHHAQLQQVARDTRQVCSAEKRSLEELLKSKDAELKQEQRRAYDSSTEAKAAKIE